MALEDVDLEHVVGVVDQVARLAHHPSGAVADDHLVGIVDRDRVLELVAAETQLGRLQRQVGTLSADADPCRHGADLLGEVALDDVFAPASVEDPHVADQEPALDLSRHGWKPCC